MAIIQNHVFDDLKVGDHASLTRTLTWEDIELFAIITGDINPAHVDEDFAKSDIFHKVIAHGMWGGSLFSTLLGTKLPGPGTIYLDQSLKFLRPVGIGDTIKVSVRVSEKIPEKRRVVLECEAHNQDNNKVIEGTALVIAPTEKIRIEGTHLPDVELIQKGRHHQHFLEEAQKFPALRTAIAHPVDDLSLKGAIEAAEKGLIIPILVGPEHKIKAAAEHAKVDISKYEIVSTVHSHDAAARCVELVREQKAGAIMKGSLHTDELMAAIVNPQKGLRTERRMSHVFVMDVPSYPKPIFITDAAINVLPNLDQKVDIIQNAIDLVLSLGIHEPKVAILSAIETVSLKIPSTLDAAALCKMAERNQITGGILDGPLAFDNAISKAAAKIKGIKSKVAGDADILVVPDLEAGNMLAKQLEYLAKAHVAGLVLGAKVPIILTSRADSSLARLASCSLAVLYSHNRVVKKV